MTVQAFRIQNFMCFEDSGWVTLRPLTLFYGRNSAGKSALLRSLLLLRQSLASPPSDSPLIFAPNDGFDFGSYQLLVRDHDMSRSITFWFRCAFDQERFPFLPNVAASREAVEGTSIQVRLSYQFGQQKVALDSVALYDQQEQPIWQATKQVDGQSWHFEADFFALKPMNVWGSTVLAVEEGFFPRLRVLSSDTAGREEVAQIQQVLCDVERSIVEFLKSLQYVGPMRASPQRFYELPHEVNGQGTNGQRLVSALLSSDAHSTLKSINEWLAEFGLPQYLVPLNAEETVHQLLFSDPLTKRFPPFQANIREVGFGLSQLLPVMVETLLAPEHSSLLLEQPELHLAPATQSELADLLIYGAVHRKVRLLVETHSENVLIRVRRRLAESHAGYVQPGDRGYLPHEALKVYFVYKEEGQSEAIPLDYTANGGMFFKPRGYKGFFSSDLRDTVLLSKAKLGK